MKLGFTPRTLKAPIARKTVPLNQQPGQRGPVPISADPSDPIQRTTFAQLWSELARVVNGRLSFGDPQQVNNLGRDNLDGNWPGVYSKVTLYSITTPGVANTEFTVNHNLGRIPVGYDIKSKDRAGSIYDSRKTLWTKTQMFLKADTASMNIVIFVH